MSKLRQFSMNINISYAFINYKFKYFILLWTKKLYQMRTNYYARLSIVIDYNSLKQNALTM